MAIQPMALQVQNPQNETMAALGAGMQNRQAFDRNQLEQARMGLETIGSVALGAMGGDLNGQVDPEIYEQGLDLLEQNGIKVDSFRGKPDAAPLVARASLTAMQQLQMAQSEREYQLALKKFEAEIAQAANTPTTYRTLNAETGAAAGLSQEQVDQLIRDNGVVQLAPDGKIVPIGGKGENVDPTEVREYNFYAEQERAAGKEPLSYLDYQQAKKGAGFSVTTADGTVVQMGGGKPLTEGQSKDTVYATRAEGALPIIDQFGIELTNPVARAVEGDPTGIARAAGQSDNFQRAQQAGLEFLQAVLRKDTGAAITPAEQQEYGRVYLPMPGDSKAVLEQKRQSRKRALEAIKAGLPPQAILAQETALANSGAPPEGQQGDVARPTTQEEYDALPSGATFIDPDDGQTYRKP